MTPDQQVRYEQAQQRIELNRARQEARDEADLAFARCILGEGTVTGIQGVGLSWPGGTPEEHIEEVRAVARQIVGWAAST